MAVTTNEEDAAVHAEIERLRAPAGDAMMAADNIVERIIRVRRRAASVELFDDWREEIAAAITAAEERGRQAERSRCREIVVQMKNQRQVYRDIIGDPKARLPQYQHWAEDIVDRISDYARGEQAGVREGIEMAAQLCRHHAGIAGSMTEARDMANFLADTIPALMPAAPKEL